MKEKIPFGSIVDMADGLSGDIYDTPGELRALVTRIHEYAEQQLDNIDRLRDEMAMAVLSGFCANSAVFAHNGMQGWALVNCKEDELMGYCYHLADKALKER